MDPAADHGPVERVEERINEGPQTNPGTLWEREYSNHTYLLVAQYSSARLEIGDLGASLEQQILSQRTTHHIKLRNLRYAIQETLTAT
jgi:hypothetical protein